MKPKEKARLWELAKEVYRVYRGRIKSPEDIRLIRRFENAASPVVILSLLDELEQKDKEIVQMREALMAIRQGAPRAIAREAIDINNTP